MMLIIITSDDNYIIISSSHQHLKIKIGVRDFGGTFLKYFLVFRSDLI
jgi:hypothetical protein